MSKIVINKLIIASNVYFWGTEEIDEVSKFWYGLFTGVSVFSLIILSLAWIF